MSFHEQKMNEITSQNVGTHGSCVHPIRLTSKQVDKLTSRQLAGHWSGRTSRASLHAFANEKTQKEANEKTQEYVGTHGSCVHSIRLISKQVDKLTSRQLARHWSGRTGRASLHAPCTQQDKESKTKEYLSYKLEIMNREQKERLHYIAPRCTVVPVEEEGFLCVSPRFDPAGSTTETNYDDKGEQ